MCEGIVNAMISRTLLFSFVIQLFVSGFLSAQEIGDLMSPSKVFFYAKDLEKSGDFNRAATEYGRLVFFFRHHPDFSFAHKDVVFYRHAVALARAGATDQALQAFSTLGALFPESRFISPALLRMGQLYEEAGAVEEAKSRYQALISRDQTFARFARARLAWLALQEEDGMKEARDHLEKIVDARSIEKISTLNHALDSLGHLPNKDPRLAGALTALLPGSGHLYLDRPKDALFAFLSNGLLVAGTVQAFQNDISGLGAALGVVELGWYTGTVFSAVSLAHKFNQEVRKEKLMKIRPLLESGKDFLGLELNLHY